jgi:phosphoenolpyruvate synthase/pyruvate phosphate dikinase
MPLKSQTDGFSIGSKDLTQLTLGIDPDSGELGDLFGEQDETVNWMIAQVIAICCKKGARLVSVRSPGVRSVPRKAVY